MKISEALTFDDVLLVPRFSDVKSRTTPNVGTKIANKNIKIPIIASPMNTVCESSMVIAMHDLGASSVLHRGISLEKTIEEIAKALKAGAKDFFVAVGATGDYLDRANRIYDTFGIMDFCIDVANGHSETCVKATEEMSKKYNVISGNVCTLEGSLRLADAGAKAIRSGIGPGSLCKTRVVTGHGVPQLTAIENCANVKNKFPDVTIIADGGIRSSGDLVKALAAGADVVMIGGLLAGTDETPGEIHHAYFAGQHRGYKTYAGMASEEGRSLNGWFEKSKTAFVPEGESVQVECKGPVKTIVESLIGGLKVGMSYSGAMTIKELQGNAEWVKVTENGRTESTPFGKSRGQ